MIHAARINALLHTNSNRNGVCPIRFDRNEVGCDDLERMVVDRKDKMHVRTTRVRLFICIHNLLLTYLALIRCNSTFLPDSMTLVKMEPECIPDRTCQE